MRIKEISIFKFLRIYLVLRVRLSSYHNVRLYLYLNYFIKMIFILIHYFNFWAFLLIFVNVHFCKKYLIMIYSCLLDSEKLS